MSKTHRFRRLCACAIFATITLSSTAWSNEDEPDIETYGYAHIDPRNADIFAVQIPGETYSPLTGAIGHKFSDLTAAGNGNLPITIQRNYKELPKEYPYAFGNMDLVIPQLSIETPFTGSDTLSDLNFICDVDETTRDQWRRISFSYGGGKVFFTPRKYIQANTLQNYPAEAILISKDNWIINCAADSSQIFEVKSPDGTVYRMAQRERYESRRQFMHNEYSGNTPPLTPNSTFTLFAKHIIKDGTTLTYDYERPASWDALDHYVYPPVIQGSQDGHRNVIRNKYRLKRITASNSLNNDHREVTINYRPDSGTCPNLISSIQSNYAKGGNVTYSYTHNTNHGSQIFIDQCLLERVTYQDSSYFHFRYGQPGKTYQFIPGSDIGSGSQPSTEDKSTAYFPIMEVTTPTGSSAQYTYMRLGTCEYQDTSKALSHMNYAVPADCGGKQVVRPAVTNRSVLELSTPIVGSTSTSFRTEVSNPSFLKSEQHFYYPLIADAFLNQVERKIVSDSRTHRLVFGRVDRHGEPNQWHWASASKIMHFGDPTQNNFGGGRLLHSGRVLMHEVSDNGSQNQAVLSTTDYTYVHNLNFIDASTLNYPRIDSEETAENHPYDVLKWNWVFDSVRTNLHSTVVNYNSSVFTTRKREFNHFNKPTHTDRIFTDSNGEITQSTKVVSYDHLPDLSQWKVGKAGATHVGKFISNGLPLIDKASFDNIYYPNGWLKNKEINGVTTDYNYYPNGDLASVTNGSGNTTTYQSYTHGSPASAVQPNAGHSFTVTNSDGTVANTIDASGKKVSYEYDLMGRISKYWIGNTSSGATHTNQAVWHNPTHALYRKKSEFRIGQYTRDSYYDALGRIVKVKTRDWASNNGTVYQRYFYDQLGRIYKVFDPTSTDIPNGSGIVYEYDAFDRIKKTYHTNTPTEKTEYCYGPPCNNDSNFNKAGPVKNGYVINDEEGFQTHYDFRALGHPGNEELMNVRQQLQVSEGGSTVNKIVRTRIARNIHGFITSVRQGYDGNNFETNDDIPERVYVPHKLSTNNVTSWIKSETHPEFGTRTVENFNGLGLPTLVTQFDNSQLEYTYDTIDNISTVKEQGGPLLAEYLYEPNGDLTKLISGDIERTYTYAPFKPLLELESVKIGANEYAIDYSYDIYGQLKGLIYPDGLSLTYTLDGLGRVDSIVANKDGRTLSLIDDADYHPSGQTKYLVHGNDQVFTTTLDNRLRPWQWTVGNSISGLEALDFEYKYDQRGNVTRINSYFGPESGDLHSLTYDGLNRLTSATGNWGTKAFTYDAQGDIKTTQLTTTTGTSSTLYNYEGEKLQSVMGALPEYGMQYDLNGNIIDTGFNSMSYDALNRMIESTVTNDLHDRIITNTYDGHDYRAITKKVVVLDSGDHTTTTHQIYSSSGDLLYESDIEAGETRSHIMLSGKTVATLGSHQNHDSDGDSIPDYYERLQGLDPLGSNDGQQDDDNDGLSNVAEYGAGTLTHSDDSDTDGLSDSWELEWGYDPTVTNNDSLDTDGDGILDIQEQANGTNPIDHRMTPAEMMYLVPVMLDHAM